MKKSDYNLISQKFKDKSNEYEKLGYNISQALELLLKENQIPYLSINYRVKDHDSFISKIERKSYNSPFDEIEDICGLRIICYYQSDIEKIKGIIKKEFNSLENENKEDNLDFDQFGYRSFHFIIKIKDEWLSTPNYRGLENLKAELQIRTVLMHAWAEIEHKLAYKSKSQIPKEFRRKLSRISAKLEESDEQFEDIKNQIEINKTTLIELAKESNGFNNNAEFNLDNFQAFLDFTFWDRLKDIKATRNLFEEMIDEKLTLKMLIDGYEKSKHILEDIEYEENILVDSQLTKGDYVWGQTGIARTILELTNKNYFEYRKKLGLDMEIIEKYKHKLN